MSKWLALLKERKNRNPPDAEPTKPTKPGCVGFVGSSAGDFQKTDAVDTAPEQYDAHVSDWEEWEERAAIMEFDAGMLRRKAEHLAAGFTDTSPVSGSEPSSHHAARA